jgi:hypothetical protein
MKVVGVLLNLNAKYLLPFDIKVKSTSSSNIWITTYNYLFSNTDYSDTAREQLHVKNINFLNNK